MPRGGFDMAVSWAVATTEYEYRCMMPAVIHHHHSISGACSKDFLRISVRVPVLVQMQR